MKFVTSPLSFLWPGFSGVARYGLWSQLAIALCFGVACQIVLSLNFLWCDFLSAFFKNSLYVGLLITWLFLNIVAGTKLKRYEKMRKSDSKGESFQEAQTYYLKGLWFEAECCLKDILKRNPFDADALLMLATLYRHVKRYSEAIRVLAELEKLDAAYRWEYEILFEKRAIKEEREALEETSENEEQPVEPIKTEEVEVDTDIQSEDIIHADFERLDEKESEPLRRCA